MFSLFNKLAGVEIVEIPSSDLLPGILKAALIMFGVAVVFGILIMWLGKVFAVPEDERIPRVADKLSGANCGGCGFAGCAAYAKALVEGATDLSKCNATSKENKDAIAKILGVEAVDSEPTYAIVHCNGGHAAKDRYNYQGYTDCVSNANTAGGKKLCNSACVGFGTCVAVCPANAIKVGEEGFATVDKTKCISCGKCIDGCPKGIIDRVPQSAKVLVACSSKCLMKEVKARGCDKGCIKCGKCEKVCAPGAITMQGNIPVIDYTKCGGCGACVDACPKQVIKKI